ncbi:hypothetical protein [Glycomyces tarimensis]
MPGDGFYDWAGRRLFLPDGSPDPATPGVYRHEYDPRTTDPSAPDSDPVSPRYEPPHLRHRPGDTFEIGGKPHDALDPGPYGTPGWRPDQRTGRHRRGELPEPLQPEPAKPSPTPRQRRRLHAEPDIDEPYRFSKLREDAWDRWLIDSEPLAAAHTTRYSAAERECGRTIAVVIRLLRWITTVLKGSATAPSDNTDLLDTQLVESLGRVQFAPAERTLQPAGHYTLEWERRFDSLNPVAGGGVL